MKKLIFTVVVLAMSLGATAQMKARWGSIDVRYPVDCETSVSDNAVNHAVAWRGERVNLQLVVENGAKESTPAKIPKPGRCKLKAPPHEWPKFETA